MLSPAGRDHLLQTLEVLDAARMASAARALTAAERGALVAGKQALIAALPPVQQEVSR